MNRLTSYHCKLRSVTKKFGQETHKNLPLMVIKIGIIHLHVSFGQSNTEPQQWPKGCMWQGGMWQLSWSVCSNYQSNLHDSMQRETGLNVLLTVELTQFNFPGVLPCSNKSYQSRHQLGQHFLTTVPLTCVQPEFPVPRRLITPQAQQRDIASTLCRPASSVCFHLTI